MQNANDRPLSKNNITTFTVLPRPCSIIPMPFAGVAPCIFFQFNTSSSVKLDAIKWQFKKALSHQSTLLSLTKQASALKEALEKSTGNFV